MSDKEKRGIKQPDFDELNDRLIAKGTSEPSFAIKTNLDGDKTGENPYYDPSQSEDEKEKFDRYFDDKA